MPGKIKVKVLAGRNLPVMDRAGDTTDAFVEIKFGGVTHKTDVCRKSLNPHWNSTEWYRFEVDESELQDEPLQLRLMDHDTYSANDAIGKVVISLAPLLAREASNPKSTTAPHGGAVMSGWIPVFDTMHGIRGELNVIVKVELFSDFNKYKTSSCGVQFFHCPMIPPGYRATSIHGFVEELVVNDDPEYQWIDKIRTPRASNEARQVAFIKLSNQVQRLVGLKAAELGANAVVGYQQEFDLEGEAGVVARAVGTAVSITPLPTPTQPVNVPPCTQQQLKKYLDILATDNESVTDFNQYYKTHQDELQKMLNILSPNASALLDEADTNDDDERSADCSRHSSITSYAGSVSIYHDEYLHHKGLRHLSEDQTDLNKLLNKESDESDSSGPLQKIKKLKSNFFSRTFSGRSKKSDKQDDSISLKSNTSESSRLSFVDIKNELKKLKRLKKPKFRKAVVVNKDDQGEGMASILARSVIHAHTGLACIAETQDSEHSPGSTMRRTSESEPTLSISGDEGANIISIGHEKDIPEIRFNSLTNINIENSDPKRERKTSESCPATPMPDRSENMLTLPNKEEYYGSVSSALSAESSEIDSQETTTDEDYDSSDLKTDTDKSIETTSSVVQSVLSHEVNPILVAHMEEKLSCLENTRSEPKAHVSDESIPQLDKNIELKQQNFNSQLLIDKCKSLESVPYELENKLEPARSNQDLKLPMKETCVIKPHTYNIKFHNPFAHKKAAKSISEPSSPVEKCSFVHRSSRRIRRQLSKLSKSNMIKSFSHYSLHPKKKETQSPLSQPGSSSNLQSKVPSDTVLGAPFLSYNDLLSLDKDSNANHKYFHKSEEFDRGKFSMYIGSEPPSRASLSGPSFSHHKEEHHDHKKSSTCLKSSGLVHTAMETILLDKVQNLLMPASPDPDSVKSKQFFADVNEKLGKVEQDRNKEFLKEKLIPIPLTIINSPSVSTKPVIVSTVYKKDKNIDLVKTAMETMLMDRVQSVLIPSTPSSPKPELIFTDPDEKRDGFKGKFKKPIEIIHSLITPKSPESIYPTEKGFDSKRKKERKQSGLIHTAMETMLLEKVQSVLGPETPEPSYFSVFDSCDMPKTETSVNENIKSSGLIQTAIETVLLDKVQTSALGGTVPDPIIQTENSDNELCKETASSGLTQTAMETILIDKVKCLVGPSDLPLLTSSIVLEHDPGMNSEYEESLKSGKKNDVGPKGCVKTPMETILLDKLNATDLGLSAVEPTVSIEESIDNVHSVDEGPEMNLVEPKTFIASKIEDSGSSGNDLKSPDLVQTALQTILLDKVQSLVGNNDLSVNSKTAAEQHIQACNQNNNDFESSGLVQIASETIPFDDIQALVPAESKIIKLDNRKGGLNLQSENQQTRNKVEPLVLVTENVATKSKPGTKLSEKSKSVPEPKIKSKKLSRQDSIHSITENESPKMSDKPNISSRDAIKTPVHPTLGMLETIPSLSEGSIDHETVEDTNVSVCHNSHAVCGANRSERERRQEDKCDRDKGSPRHARHESYGGKEPPPPHVQNTSLNASSTPMGIHRRSSDSDLSVTPKGSSLNTSAGNVGSGGGAILRPSMNSNNLDMLEYPFLTMTEYPPGFIVHIGGTVCARSVKLADGEGAARAAAWAELRTELRAHARALRCNAVLAYCDTAAICEDVCVLSASGTAAVINLDCDFNAEIDAPPVKVSSTGAPDEHGAECSAAHVPFAPAAGPHRAELALCAACRRARVPNVLLATCAKPNKLASQAKAVTITAVAARVRRAPPTSEPGARDISDQLPFLEYELHKLLLAKLRMQGANAIFSLQTQIAVGERCVMALASGTAFKLSALPDPTPPTIKASENDKDAAEIQKALWDTFTANRAANGYDVGVAEHNTNGVLPETDGEDPPALDLCGDKDACVLELDEAEDVETARGLAQRHVNMQVYTNSLRPVVGAAPHAFTQVWRGRVALAGGAASGAGERHVRRALAGVAYKLRRLQPCALVAPRLRLELPEDEIQLVVSGAAIPLQDPNNPDTSSTDTHSGNPSSVHPGTHNHGSSEDDDIFALDEEQSVKPAPTNEVVEEKISNNSQVCVALTSLCAMSGGRAARRVCALRLLFVRETTAVRELGGLSGFLHTFTCEVLAIARAYTAALGGNALTSFYITQLMLQDNAHKNQGQCLLSVGGDVVHITY